MLSLARRRAMSCRFRTRLQGANANWSRPRNSIDCKLHIGLRGTDNRTASLQAGVAREISSTTTTHRHVALRGRPRLLRMHPLISQPLPTHKILSNRSVAHLFCSPFSTTADAGRVPDRGHESVGYASEDEKKKHDALLAIGRLVKSRQGPQVVSAVDELMESPMSELLTEGDFVFLIQKLGFSRKPERAVMLHDQMMAVGIGPNLLTYSATLSACALLFKDIAKKQGCADEAASLEQTVQDLYLEMIEDYGIKPDVVVHHHRMKMCRNFSDLWDIVESDILGQGLQPVPMTLTSLITSGLENHDATGVVTRYDYLVDKYPDCEDFATRAQVLEAYVRLTDNRGRFHLALDSLMEDLETERDEIQGSKQQVLVYEILLNVCARNSLSHEAVRVIEHASGRATNSPPVPLGIRPYRSAILACTYAGLGRAAVRLFTEFVPGHLRFQLVSDVMKASNAGENYRKTLVLYKEVWDQLNDTVDESRNKQQGPKTSLLRKERDFFHHAIEAACHLKKPDRAFIVLSDMHSAGVRISTFAMNNVLQAAGLTEQKEYWPVAIELFNQRVEQGLLIPNIYSFQVIMGGFFRRQEFDEVIHSYKQMDIFGVAYSATTHLLYLYALLESTSYARAVAFYAEMPTKTKSALRSHLSRGTGRSWMPWTNAINRCLSGSDAENGLLDAVHLWQQLRFLRGWPQEDAAFAEGYEVVCRRLQQGLDQHVEEDEDDVDSLWVQDVRQDIDNELQWIVESRDVETADSEASGHRRFRTRSQRFHDKRQRRRRAR